MMGSSPPPGRTGIKPSHFTQWKNRFAKGETLGARLLRDYAGEALPSDSEILRLTNSLVDSGWLGKIYAQVQERVDEEMAAVAEEERKQEEARKKAEAKAKREAEAARKASELARKKAEQAKAANKAAAEARAKEAERQAKKRAELRAAEAKRMAEERQRAAERKAEMKRRQNDAKAAAKGAKEAAKGLHPDVLSMIKSATHQDAFRKVVLTDMGKKVFPMASQVKVVNQMLRWHEDNDVELSRFSIKEYLNDIIIQHNAHLRKLMEEAKKREEKASIRRKVDNRIKAYKSSVVATNNALLKLAEVLDDEATGRYAFYEIATDPRLSRSLVQLEDMVTRVRSNLNLWESRTKKNAADGTIVSDQ
jgi:multidrug efflux pump subunit AcrA (membrane-fusion protein)